MASGKDGEAVFSGEIDGVSGFDSDEFADHASAIEFLPGTEHSPGILHNFLGQVDDRGFHLHHAASGDEDGESCEVIKVSVSDEESAVPHEGPRAGTEFKADPKFGYSPVALDGCA